MREGKDYGERKGAPEAEREQERRRESRCPTSSSFCNVDFRSASVRADSPGTRMKNTFFLLCLLGL